MVLSAVGITKEGELVSLDNLDTVRGCTFAQIYISRSHKSWAIANKDLLETFLVENGMIMLLGKMERLFIPLDKWEVRD